MATRREATYRYNAHQGSSFCVELNFFRFFGVNPVPVAAEAVFGWRCKHLSKVPRQHGPKERGPLPHFF